MKYRLVSVYSNIIDECQLVSITLANGKPCDTCCQHSSIRFLNSLASVHAPHCLRLLFFRARFQTDHFHRGMYFTVVDMGKPTSVDFLALVEAVDELVRVNVGQCDCSRHSWSMLLVYMAGIALLSGIFTREAAV